MPWSINEALDVVKWIIETHGGNDDHQAWRQICAYIAEAEKPSHNRPSAPLNKCRICGCIMDDVCSKCPSI